VIALNGVVGPLMILAAILAALGLFTALHARWIEKRFPPRGDLVAIDGGAIHVVEARAEGVERGVVLLLHGASGNHADMMVALARPLAAQGFRVLAVDRPGHGWSGRICGRRASSPARQAEFIRAALARRGVRQAIVVGHSLAGVLALALALDAPEFTRALVLLAPVSHPWPGGVNWHYTIAAQRAVGWAFRQFVVTPIGLLALRSGLREVFVPNAIPANYVAASALKLMFRPKHFLANAEDVVDLKSFVTAQAPRYGLIAAPTEVVTGDNDGVVYTHIHSIGCARDIPGAVLTTLPGVGHSPHHCATEDVVAAIVRADRRAIKRGEEYVQDIEDTPAAI
jgi:pimeloyl-ACP methyl ester carboxylesterase